MKRKVTTAILGLMAALALAVVGVGAASAQGGTTEADTRYDQLINRVAQLLGKQPAEVKSALTQAAEEQLDQAVKAGEITQARANAIKERIAETGRPFPFFGRHGGGLGHHRGIRGEVTKVSGATLTVETRAGTSKTVKLMDDTEISDEGEEAQASAIKVGGVVRVVGDADADGVVAADAVLIGEPRGRGFPGRGGHHHGGPWGDRGDEGAPSTP